MLGQSITNQAFAGNVGLGNQIPGAGLAFHVAKPGFLHPAHEFAGLARDVDDDFHIFQIEVHTIFPPDFPRYSCAR